MRILYVILLTFFYFQFSILYAQSVELDRNRDTKVNALKNELERLKINIKDDETAFLLICPFRQCREGDETLQELHQNSINKLNEKSSSIEKILSENKKLDALFVKRNALIENDNVEDTAGYAELTKNIDDLKSEIDTSLANYEKQFPGNKTSNDSLNTTEEELEVKDENYKNCSNPIFIDTFPPKISQSSMNQTLEQLQCSNPKATPESLNATEKKCLQEKSKTCVAYLQCEHKGVKYIRPSTCRASYCDEKNKNAQKCVNDLTRSFSKDTTNNNIHNTKIKTPVKTGKK